MAVGGFGSSPLASLENPASHDLCRVSVLSLSGYEVLGGLVLQRSADSMVLSEQYCHFLLTTTSPEILRTQSQSFRSGPLSRQDAFLGWTLVLGREATPLADTD